MSVRLAVLVAKVGGRSAGLGTGITGAATGAAVLEPPPPQLRKAHPRKRPHKSLVSINLPFESIGEGRFLMKIDKKFYKIFVEFLCDLKQYVSG